MTTNNENTATPILAIVHLPEQKIAPRMERGCDHGAEGAIIAESDDGARLIWRKGHTGWSGRGETGYYRAELSIYDHRKPGERYHGAHHSIMIFEGGRCTTNKMIEHADKIHEAFPGLDCSKLDPKKTIRVEGLRLHFQPLRDQIAAKKREQEEREQAERDALTRAQRAAFDRAVELSGAEPSGKGQFLAAEIAGLAIREHSAERVTITGPVTPEQAAVIAEILKGATITVPAPSFNERQQRAINIGVSIALNRPEQDRDPERALSDALALIPGAHFEAPEILAAATAEIRRRVDGAS